VVSAPPVREALSAFLRCPERKDGCEVDVLTIPTGVLPSTSAALGLLAGLHRSRNCPYCRARRTPINEDPRSESKQTHKSSIALFFFLLFLKICKSIHISLTDVHALDDLSAHNRRPTSNIAWGEDGQTLFITGGISIYRLRFDEVWRTTPSVRKRSVRRQRWCRKFGQMDMCESCSTQAAERTANRGARA
jgi:hypothetical protein